jgi:hypothetical protein
MDAREREISQSHRPNIKRPWEEDTTVPEQRNVWPGARLPPLEAISLAGSSTLRTADSGDSGGDYRPHGLTARDLVSKKPRFEGEDYNTLSSPNQPVLSGRVPMSGRSNVMYRKDRGSLATFSVPPSQREDLPGSASSQNPSNLYQQCRRTIQNQDIDALGVSESCETCNRDLELAHVTQAAAAALTQLTETLRSGTSSEHRGITYVS